MDENERGEPGSRTRPWHPLVPMDDHRQRRLREKIDDVLRDLGLVPTDDYGDYDLQSIRIDATEGRGDTNDLYYRITINVAEPWEPPPENTRAKGTHLRVVKENKPMKLTKQSLQHLIRQVLKEADYSRLVQDLADDEGGLSPVGAMQEVLVLLDDPSIQEDPMGALEEIMEFAEEAMGYVFEHPEEFEGEEGDTGMIRTLDSVESVEPGKAFAQIKELAQRGAETEQQAYEAMREMMNHVQGAIDYLMNQGEN